MRVGGGSLLTKDVPWRNGLLHVLDKVPLPPEWVAKLEGHLRHRAGDRGGRGSLDHHWGGGGEAEKIRVNAAVGLAAPQTRGRHQHFALNWDGIRKLHYVLLKGLLGGCIMGRVHDPRRAPVGSSNVTAWPL